MFDLLLRILEIHLPEYLNIIVSTHSLISAYFMNTHTYKQTCTQVFVLCPLITFLSLYARIVLSLSHTRIRVFNNVDSYNFYLIINFG